MLLLTYYGEVTQMSVGILGHYLKTSQHILSEIGQNAFVIGRLKYAVRVVVLRSVEQVA